MSKTNELTVSWAVLLLITNMNEQAEKGSWLAAKETAGRIISAAAPYRTQGKVHDNWANAACTVAQMVLDYPLA